MNINLKTLKKGLTALCGYRAYSVKIQKDEKGRIYLKYYKDFQEVDSYENHAYHIDLLIKSAKEWLALKGYTTDLWSY